MLPKQNHSESHVLSPNKEDKGPPFGFMMDCQSGLLLNNEHASSYLWLTADRHAYTWQSFGSYDA